MATLTEVTSANFDQSVLQAKGPVLVDFWATWCTSCIALMPKLEEIGAELGSQVTLVKVNTEEYPEIAVKYSVRGLPALLFFKDGEVKNFLTGNHPKATILDMLKGLI